MSPKVSVLIPAYNHERYINDTINSVLTQTFTDLELLIYDDCSTDNTAEIIRGFSDERITAVFPDKNGGTVAALNHLLKMAKGEYISVLGSDDIWEQNKLERQIEILENNPEIAACFSKAEIINQDSQPIVDSSIFPIDIFDCENRESPSILCDFFFTGNHLCHSSAVIRADIHSKIGFYNPAYRQLHDFDLWVRLLLDHKIHIIDSKLVRYRFVQSSNNLSESNNSNNNRLYNEAVSIILYLLENISDEDFIKGFSNHFVDINAKSNAQLICEKILLLKNYGIWNCPSRSLTINFISRNLNDDAVDCFEKNYGISLKDIYDYTGEFSESRIEAILDENTQLKRQLDEIYSSKAWKLISFLRKFITKG